MCLEIQGGKSSRCDEGLRIKAILRPIEKTRNLRKNNPGKEMRVVKQWRE
jgi:hypothetical protein